MTEEAYLTKFLRRYLKRREAMFKIYGSITDGFAKEIKELDKGKPSPKKIKMVVDHYEEFQSSADPLLQKIYEKSADENEFKEIVEFMAAFRKLSKEELVDRLASISFEYELFSLEIEYLSLACLYFSKSLTKKRITEISIDTKRQGNRRIKESINDECLRECLETLKKRLERPLKDTDFPKFIKVVKELYPLQPYVKAARLTLEEKTLPREQQEEIRLMKSDPKWKPSRLYKFFEDETGLKPTTKKHSSLK